MELVAKGKTKAISKFEISGRGLVKSFPIVSWGNKHEVELPGKDVWATTTASAMFRILKAKERDVAFDEQVSPNEFTAPIVDMIKIEAVCRFDNGDRSSYHKRHPEVPLGKLETPVVELFLKTTKGWFGEPDLLGSFKLPDGMPDDPLIVKSDPDGVWVHHPARPVDNSQLVMVPYVPEGFFHGEVGDLMTEVMQFTGTDASIIRDAWATIGWNLSDVKIEYGLMPTERKVPRTHRIVTADVIDNDSWRLQDEQGVEHSKQVVRDKNSVEGADVHYALVAEKALELANRLAPL